MNAAPFQAEASGRAVVPAVAACCVALWSFTVAVNWPGHYSLDSLIQLAEGMTGDRATFHPPFMGVVLGALSRWFGHGAFMALDAALYFIALALVAGRSWSGSTPRRRATVLAAAALVALNPVTLIYNGTVWKDVLCANLLLLACALVWIPSRDGRWPRVLAALLLAAMATSTRQHGAVGALVVCAGAGWTLRATPRRSSGLPARFALAAVLCIGMTMALQALAASQIKPVAWRKAASGTSTGLQLVLRFDIAGMVVHGHAAEDVLARHVADPPAVVAAARRYYTPERIDFLEPFQAAMAIERDRVPPLWWDLVRAEPSALWRHKIATAASLLGSRAVGRCLPAHLGVAFEGMATVSASLPYVFAPGFVPDVSPYLSSLYRYLQAGLPLFAGWPWTIVLAAVGVLGWRRRDPLAIALASAGGLYMLEFVAANLACDFRYIYFGVAAAMMGSLSLLATAPAGSRRAAALSRHA